MAGRLNVDGCHEILSAFGMFDAKSIEEGESSHGLQGVSVRDLLGSPLEDQADKIAEPRLTGWAKLG
ncbi:hypothetical protein U1703_09195 [Sphingomonas sp. PB1R3]